MRMLVGLRWVLLLAALACGVLCALPLVAPPELIDARLFDAMMVGAAVLQALGVFAMQRHGGARWWAVLAGFLAALAWAAAYASALAGIAAGPGGLVYGLLIMLPTMGLGVALQVAALIGFALRRAN